MSPTPVAAPELECGWCGRALELPRMPATLVAQCGFCKKALDLAPAVTALAPAPAPAPLESIAEITEENGVRIARGPERVELTLDVGSIHWTLRFVCLVGLMLGLMPLLAEWRRPFDWAFWSWHSLVTFTPTVYWIYWNFFGRWKVTLGTEGLSRESTAWPGDVDTWLREQVGQCALVQHTAPEWRRGPKYRYDVEIKVAGKPRFQTFIPRLLSQGQAWVVYREIGQWLARTQKPSRGDG